MYVRICVRKTRLVSVLQYSILKYVHVKAIFMGTQTEGTLSPIIYVHICTYVYTYMATYMTGFVKTLHLHTSNFLNLTLHNFNIQRY